MTPVGLTDPATGAETGHPLPRRGDYSHQPLVGVYRVDPDEAGRQTYFGLGLKTTLCYGTFRDEEGGLYAVLRKLGADSLGPLALQTTVGSDHGAFAAHPRGNQAFSGPGLVRVATASDQRHLISPAIAGGGGFSLRHGPHGAEWRDDDVLALSGWLVGDVGLQWFDPSPPGCYYTSESFRAGGSILGRPVEGFFAVDQLYFPPGMTWFESPYFSAPPYLEIAWHMFGNEYDDGSVEVGSIFAGARRFSFAAICDSEGGVTTTREVTADLEVDDDAYPTRGRFAVGGEQWEWTADPAGRMPDFAAGYPGGKYRPSEGRFVRVDESRDVSVWWSFIDTWAESRPRW